MPVPDIDDVQCEFAGERAPDRRGKEDPKRTASDRFPACLVRAVPAGAQIEVVIADEHLGHDGVGKLQPAGLIQEEIVLQALSDQQVA